MAWIESHQELRHHPKVIRLARLLDVHRTTAVGLLHFLWWWALDHAEDGDLSEYDAVDIAEACMWDGDPEALVKALIECGPGSKPGFVEEDSEGRWVLHNWWQYAGKLVARRRADRERKRATRGSSPAGPSDVGETSTGRPADVAETAYVTEQNRTEQNRVGAARPSFAVTDDRGRRPSQERSQVRSVVRSQGVADAIGGAIALASPETETETESEIDGSVRVATATNGSRAADVAASPPSHDERRRRRSRAPSSFEVTDDLRAWAAAKKLDLVDLDAETERFLDHHRAKGSLMSDWTAAWRTWMRRAQQYAAERGRPERNGFGWRLDANGNRVMT